jgi:hypothetical protein
LLIILQLDLGEYRDAFDKDLPQSINFDDILCTKFKSSRYSHSVIGDMMLKLAGFTFKEMIRNAQQIHSIMEAHTSVASLQQLMEEANIDDRVIGLIRASLLLSDQLVLNKHNQICLM